MIRKYVALLVVLSLIAGCAPALNRGTVAMKVADDEAHICLGKGEVKVGDKVALSRNVCSSLRKSGGKQFQRSRSACQLQTVGQGEVVELLNEHYSVAKFPAGTDFKEGDIVERR